MSAPDMDPPASARIDLGRLLDAAEAAAPVDAVDAVAAELQDMVGADSVSFLIADFTPQRITLRFFRWNAFTQTEPEIDRLQPFRVLELEPA